MINKSTLQSIISKYYLGVNESVKWEIENNALCVEFMTPTKDVIGNVEVTNFPVDGSHKLAIYDTKKLSNLISICNGDLLLELEKNREIYTKLHISDLNFNLSYALSDPLLINKVGTVNEPEYVVDAQLEQEDVDNIIKAKSALAGVDNMLITTTQDLDGNNVIEFIFGDESGHNNKITYQVKGDIQELDMKLPFNSDTFRTILQANKDMGGGSLKLSTMGLMYLEFVNEETATTSRYFMVRKAETDF